MSCAYCKNITVCVICGKGVTAATFKPTMGAETLYVANANGVDWDPLTGSALLDCYERAVLKNARIESNPYADAEDRGDARRSLDRVRAAILGSMVVCECAEIDAADRHFPKG